jgi:hypothetical protein
MNEAKGAVFDYDFLSACACAIQFLPLSDQGLLFDESQRDHDHA